MTWRDSKIQDCNQQDIFYIIYKRVKIRQLAEHFFIEPGKGGFARRGEIRIHFGLPLSLQQLLFVSSGFESFTSILLYLHFTSRHVFLFTRKPNTKEKNCRLQ
jgi:hypothetical protein